MLYIGGIMGLSNVIASGIMIIVMIQVFLLFTFKSIGSITETAKALSQQPVINDMCSISGIVVSGLGGNTIISVNISNTGSEEWWDYNKSHIILEILLTNGSKVLTYSKIQDLGRAIYNNTINPGIVDPGEILLVNYTVYNLDPSNISSLKAIFSTLYGGGCSATR